MHWHSHYCYAATRVEDSNTRLPGGQGKYGEIFLADDFLFQRDRTSTPRGALDAVTELANVDLQFADGAAERVTVHAQFARGTALVSLVFLEHRQNEALFEFAHAFGVKNVALVHLQNKCFQLVFHDASLFAMKLFTAPRLLWAGIGSTIRFLGSLIQ
jgi:hypothetical protein